MLTLIQIELSSRLVHCPFDRMNKLDCSFEIEIGIE